MYRFDVLQLHDARAGAVTVAAQSHFLIVSAQAHTPPPTPVGQWMQEWPPTSGPRAVLLLLEGHPSDAQPLTDHFRQLSLSRGMDFLASTCEEAGETFFQGDRLFPNALQLGSHHAHPAQFDSRQGYTRGGINE